MKNKSIWQDTKNIRSIKDIPSKLETDILIIGGGITGLTLAYLFKDVNKRVALVDKSYVGMGITSRTTAKINYFQGTIYQDLESSFNLDVSKNYFNSQKEAAEIIKNIVIENKIDCDLEQVDSVVFTFNDKNKKKIEKEKRILSSFGVEVKNFKNSKIETGIKVSDTYVFNPLKYLEGIRKIVENKIDIYESVLVQNVNKKRNKYEIMTNRGIINSNIVITCCHYPFFLLPSLIPIKTYVKREYVNAKKVDKQEKVTMINIDKELYSIRYYKDYLIYGSNDKRLTSKFNYYDEYEKSINKFRELFDEEPDYTWMNQDIISNDKLPLIGEVKQNLFLATAYNSWGMTNGTIAAKVIFDLIINGDSPYKKLFSPKRINMNLLLNSFIGAFHYLKAYVGTWFYDNPYYIKKDGLIYGIYIDETGAKHSIKLLCPHMKCHLVFNDKEKTWDCPCHGSRFDIDGNILEGPAKEKISKDE